MKKVILFLCVYTPMTISAQQSDIKGVVSIHNSQFKTGTRQYVQNAQVEDDFAKATPTTTDATGNFKLVFVGADKGKSVVLSIKKAGLQVVNTPDLTAVAGQTDALKISMAHPDSIAEYRKRLYNIGKSEAEKNLYAQLKKKGAAIEALQKDAQKNAAAIEKLQHEYAELDKYAKNIEEQAQDLARRYAPINLDDAAPLYREAFGYFQEGNLEKAMQILRGADLIGQADKIFANRKFIRELDSIEKQRTKDLLQVLGLKADLHQSKFEWDSVQVCLELRVKLDSTNVDNLSILAYFLLNQNKTDKAIYYYERALSLSKTEDLIGLFCMNLGVCYSRINKMSEAEKYYLQSLDIYARLAKSKPQQFESDWARTAMNLGMHYMENGKMPEAEKCYLQSLDIQVRLSKSDPKQFEPDLTKTLLNLGVYYWYKKMPEAEKYYLQALDVLARLAKSNLQQFEPDLAKAAISLGLYYQDVSNMIEAEKYYLQALDVLARLAKSNPQQFEPDLAKIVNNLGEYYRVNNKMPKAEKYFLQAMDIRTRLSKSNPDQFESFLANTLMNLGIYYSDVDSMSEAEKYYLVALDIRIRLAKSNPQRFEPDLAKNAMNLGVHYYTVRKMPEGEKYLLQALGIYTRLVKSDSLQFELELAKTTMNLGLYYEKNNNVPEAERYYLQSLDVAMRLVKRNPIQFKPYLASILHNFGTFYIDTKQLDKAQNLYSFALTLCQEALMSGQTHILEEYIRVYTNLEIIRDTFGIQKNYDKVVEIQTELVKSKDILRGVLENTNETVVDTYFQLYWYQLLAKQYLTAEQTARHCLEVDSTQIHLKMMIAYSLLFQNKEVEAKKIYNELKNLKDEKGNDMRSLVISNLTTFELSDLDKTQIEKIWKWVME